ncbi:Hep/Hag repeat protein [Phytophthora palmivora]|uniref:Hep/Hag repeat protein n=1 Tax=Phytophthora palmivora TaxID=4796 RepID=A0A2P4XLX8_9STRA|nr:Hep/Hag repeat protein [Phytophthora palmivora]
MSFSTLHIRGVFCILFLGFVTLITHPPVVVATDSIKNPEFEPVETPVIASTDGTTGVARLLRRESGTTNDDTTVVDKKALFVDILVLSDPETEERNILGSTVGAIFKVLEKAVGRAKADKWKANYFEFMHPILYKMGLTPGHLYTKASTKTNPKTQAKYMRAGARFEEYLKRKQAREAPQP